MKIRRFEEMLCRQKARELANAVYDLTEKPSFSRDYRLQDQIRDAAGSVMHNVAEGFDAGTDPEFIRFLKTARRSGSEVQSQLYLAIDRKYIAEPERHHAYALADEAKRLINGLIGYLRQEKCTGGIREPGIEYSYSTHPPNDSFGREIDQESNRLRD